MSKPPFFQPTGQGSRKQPGGPTFRWAILTFLLLHGLLFTGLLLQGCRPKTEVANAPPMTNTNLLNLDELWQQPPAKPAPAPEPVVPTPAPEKTPAPAPAASQPAPAHPAPPPPATNEIRAVPPTPPAIQTNLAETSPPPEPQPGTTMEESESLSGAREYVVQAGDTFWNLAQKFGISVAALEQANRTVEPTKLQIGTTLIIPPPPKSAPAVEKTYDGTIYLIKKGDSLSKIARKFGVTVEAIRKENHLQSYTIYAGKKLKIPAAPAPKP